MSNITQIIETGDWSNKMGRNRRDIVKGMGMWIGKSEEAEKWVEEVERFTRSGLNVEAYDRVTAYEEVEDNSSNNNNNNSRDLEE